ncbi:MAG: hypothetical protein PHD95_05660 [Candidatus ainarchaeum sp.]|nr:hypothetical protein [Candidatus ainarchaeum sp.]
MLAFALSKMNLLILVTALFAIVAYFMFGLTDFFVASSATQMVNAKAEQALGIANSNKLCFSSPVNIPSAIKYFGGSKDFFYAMKISREPETTVSGENNTLIFSIVNRREQNRIIAAKSIDIDAEIILFEWSYDNATGIDALKQKNSIVVDPQAANPQNSFMLIKETFKGKNYVYVISCSFTSDICYGNMQDIRVKIKSGCIPNVEAHDSSCFCIPGGVFDSLPGINNPIGTTTGCPPVDPPAKSCFRPGCESCTGGSQ